MSSVASQEPSERSLALGTKVVMAAFIGKAAPLPGQIKPGGCSFFLHSTW
jgi:hypothetical protein